MHGVQLKDLVMHVRSELESLDAERQKSGREALFELEVLELELRCTVSENTTVKGGFDLKVISFGSDLSEADQTVQTIKLRYRVAQKPGMPPPTGSRGHSTALGSADQRGVEPLSQQ